MENVENDGFNLGYREAGVDRDVSNEAKFRISQVARSTFSPDVIGEIGGFGSLYKLNGFKNPVLVSHTDSVGTKIRIGASLGPNSRAGRRRSTRCASARCAAAAEATSAHAAGEHR